MTQYIHTPAARRLLARTFFLSAVLLAAGFAPMANAAKLIKEFKGTGSKTTAEFEVEAPWIIDWRTRGDYPGSMAFVLTLVTSPGGEYVGKVATTKWVDNGVKMFNEGGRYRLQVDVSLMDWTIKVQQLTKKEAETYGVKQPASSTD